MFGHDKRDMTSVSHIKVPAKGLDKVRLGIITPSKKYHEFFPHLQSWLARLNSRLEGFAEFIAD